MSRNSSGDYTLPAGNPVATGATISSTTHNNTMSDIATELSDSLSRSGKGGMSAPLELDDGSVSAPGVTFSSDTNTGWYRPGADRLGMAVGGVKVGEWDIDGLEVQDGGSDDPQIRLLSNAGTEMARLAHTGASELKLLSLEHGVPVQLSGEDTGGTEQVLFKADPDGEAELYRAGTLALTTGAAGVQVQHGSADDPALDLASNAGTVLGKVLHTGGTGLELRSVEHGADVLLTGEDAGGTLRTLLHGDPDGDVELYHDATKAFVTEATGIGVLDTTGSNPTVNLRDNSETALAQLLYSSGLQLKSLVHGAAITLRGEDNSGTEQFVFNADPDAGAAVYFRGLLSTRTINSGLEVHSTVDDTPTLNLYQDDNATRNALIQAGLTALTITNEVHGAPITLRSEDAGGTSRVLFTGDPDGSSGLYESGVIAVKTETTGASIRHSSTDDPQLDLADNAGTVLGRVLHAGGSGLTLRSVEHGTRVFLQGEDTGGVLRDMVTADPDGAVTLENAGTDSLRTASSASGASGAEVYDGTNWYPVGFRVTPITAVSANTDLRLANVGHTLHVTASATVDMDTTTDSADNGSVWKIVNRSGGDISVTATGVTLSHIDGAGTTGTVTMADDTSLIVTKLSNGQYIAEGSAL